MKNLLVSLLMLCTALCFAQITVTQDCQSDRYKEQVFSNIKVTTDLVYGSAWGVNDVFGASDLTMDFYEPAPNDEYLDKRPLVVMFFGGAFLIGDKSDKDMMTWCDSLARYGYACAAVNYRLDNAANIAVSGNAVRAAYRPIQDGRAAIRYMLEDPDNFAFNIDPDHIYVGGQSAGAITAIHIAYLDSLERPEETYGNLIQDDLGCLDCSGNTYDQPFTIAGVIDLWGATLDPEFLDASENVPMLIIHGTSDDVILFDSGQPFTIPFLGFSPIFTFPVMYGAVPLEATLSAKGIYNEFYPYDGQEHVFYGTNDDFPTEFWLPIWEQGHNFLHNTLKFDSPVPTGLVSVCTGTTETYSFTQNPASSYCWDVTGGNIVQITDNTISVEWAGTGTGQVMLTEENCIDVIGTTAILDVAINALPEAEFSYNATDSVTVTFTDLSNNDIIAWFWQFGDGNTSSVQNPLHTYSTSGIYSVSLTVTDSNGCKGTHIVTNCLFYGASCNDNNLSTINDTYNDQCKCIGMPIAQNNCSDLDLMLSDAPISTGIYDAIQSITSTAMVTNGSSVSHIAGDIVTLGDGFTVESDAYFVADIIPCPPLAVSGFDLVLRETQDGMAVYCSDPEFDLNKAKVRLYDIGGKFREIPLRLIDGKIIPTEPIYMGMYILEVKWKENTVSKRFYK